MKKWLGSLGLCALVVLSACGSENSAMEVAGAEESDAVDMFEKITGGELFYTAFDITDATTRSLRVNIEQYKDGELIEDHGGLELSGFLEDSTEGNLAVSFTEKTAEDNRTMVIDVMVETISDQNTSQSRTSVEMDVEDNGYGFDVLTESASFEVGDEKIVALYQGTGDTDELRPITTEASEEDLAEQPHVIVVKLRIDGETDN
ncbi:hypothetical protein FLK61_25015 [Paenalkalicoccus suaedae]|uniref:Uncharacterized protein n=2 Tax=Paenalkalicoccus suaedae TaxID=2592382 RepID=A0A859FAQ1_9BACI|nr:hypothetical protein FLK61_25015 [Paenalkalicoccus suaedae]